MNARANQTDQKMICVAAIGGARGVHGDVRLRTFTDEPETVARFGTLYSVDGQKTYALLNPKVVNGDVVSRIDGIQSREDAIAMKGTELFVPREALADVDDEAEFYVTDLIGLRVVDASGAELGLVKSVDNYGASDVLEITLNDVTGIENESHQGAALKGDSLLLPFTKELVPEVNVASGCITVIVPNELTAEGPDGPEGGEHDD